MLPMPCKQPLRVELNGHQIRQEAPGGWFQFQSLNYAIYTNGSRKQRFSDIRYRLMVRAIHAQSGATCRLSQERA